MIDSPASTKQEKAPAFVRSADTTPGTNASGSWAVRMNGIGKQYKLGEVSKLNDNFREDMMNWFGGLIGREKSKRKDDKFWALQNIDLELNRGDTVGIIGRNGAGKSTLLKVLSRITSPTVGEMQYRGRLASLLEVGTGFHRELTGRENIYLNGSILGMRRHEIAEQFDAIVDFAGIEKFLDTPVKFYSSGMYVRLAFAVAAHLRTDILVVDEVLAVGDAQFQKKCLGKMQDVASDGRTILFVSHNIVAVRNLCKKAAWLSEGKLQEYGDVIPTTESYMQATGYCDSIEDISKQIEELPEDPDFELKSVEITQDGKVPFEVANSKPISIDFSFRIKNKVSGLRLYFDICDEEFNVLIRSFHDSYEENVKELEKGLYKSNAEFPSNLLAPSKYFLVIRCGIFNVRSCVGSGVVVPLQVLETTDFNRAYTQDQVRWKIQPQVNWQTQLIENK